MSWFSAFRTPGWPTAYGPNKTAVTEDVLITGFLYAIAICGLSLLLIVPGVKGVQGVLGALRVFLGILITGAIMVCNFGQEWEVASLHTRTAYKVGFRGEIHADITMKIGLRSINITLVGVPVVQELGEGNETINYNERFSWANQGWTEGRLGFGQFAGRMNQEFRAAQYKGLPYPILWIAEYFTIDGEGIRWGRFYRQAGYYSHIMCWLSLALWFLALCMAQMVIRYSAYSCMLTGGALLMANLIFGSVRNPTELHIPFEDGFLELQWGWTFWLCLVTGGFCVILGAGILVAERCFYSVLCSSTDANDYEEYFTSADEIIPRFRNIEAKEIKLGKELPDDESSSDDDYIYENPEPIVRAFRKRGLLSPRRGGGGQASPLPHSSHRHSQAPHDNPIFMEDVIINRAISIHPPPRVLTLDPKVSSPAVRQH